MTQIPANYAPLARSERRPARGARRVGSADQNEKLSVSIRIRRRADSPQLPENLNASPSLIRRKAVISREEFAAKYGADPADIEKVAQFARSNGLALEEISIPRRTVVASGTVAQMSHAFGVELGQYESPNGGYRGREGQIHLPKHLTEIVEGIFGLDNRRMARPFIVHGGANTPVAKTTQGSTAMNTTALTPPQVARLYNFPTAPASVAQETIGILEFGGGYHTIDIQTYFNNLKLPVPKLTAISVDGVGNSPGTAAHPNGYDPEVVLDICLAGAVAPSTPIAVYFAPWTEQGWVDVVTTAIHDATNHPSVISISYGWPENETIGGLTWSQQAVDAVSATFQEAAMLGVTILVASGDDGSNCNISDGKAHVNYPASDPWATSVGGTSISNVAGTAFNQGTWNNGFAGHATGGGISALFTPSPYWQGWANLPPSANSGATAGRGVPDIAGNADPNSGYELVLYGANYGPEGGTSAAAPLYAGLIAILNATLGEPVGYLNYNLYAFAGTNVFNDINDGVSNAVPGEPAPGYKSGPGWDACTGYGSVNGLALLYALTGSGLPVAAVDLNSTLYAIWKGMERDERIWYSGLQGGNWAAQRQVPGIFTSSGVAGAPLGNRLLLAWKGEDNLGAWSGPSAGDQRIWYTLFDPTTGADTPQQIVPNTGTSTGPRLATMGNNVYMAWKGEEGDRRLWWNMFNGTSWTPQAMIPNTASSVAPVLAVLNNVLYACWKGDFGDPGIYYSSFNGTTWAPQKQIQNVGTSEGPSIAAFNGHLIAVWKGEFMDQGLYVSSFNPATGTWTPQINIPNVASSVGPGLAVVGNLLYAIWKGESGDQSIWYSSTTNGTTWAAQKQIPNVGTSPDLATTGQATTTTTSTRETATHKH